MRVYGNNLQLTASEIAQEVVATGKSTGWSGYDYDFFLKLKEYLEKFNIIYVDDFIGEWALKP